MELPSETLLQILLDTDTKDLINICSSNSEINAICKADYFWRLKLQRDYQIDIIPDNMSPREYYMWWYIPKSIPVFSGEIVRPVFRDIIIVKRTESLRDLLNKSSSLFPGKFFDDIYFLDSRNNTIFNISVRQQFGAPFNIYDSQYIRSQIGNINLDAPLVEKLDFIDSIIYDINTMMEFNEHGEVIYLDDEE